RTQECVFDLEGVQLMAEMSHVFCSLGLHLMRPMKLVAQPLDFGVQPHGLEALFLDLFFGPPQAFLQLLDLCRALSQLLTEAIAIEGYLGEVAPLLGRLRRRKRELALPRLRVFQTGTEHLDLGRPACGVVLALLQRLLETRLLAPRELEIRFYTAKELAGAFTLGDRHLELCPKGVPLGQQSLATMLQRLTAFVDPCELVGLPV